MAAVITGTLSRAKLQSNHHHQHVDTHVILTVFFQARCPLYHPKGIVNNHYSETLPLLKSLIISAQKKQQKPQINDNKDHAEVTITLTQTATCNRLP